MEQWKRLSKRFQTNDDLPALIGRQEHGKFPFNWKFAGKSVRMIIYSEDAILNRILFYFPL